MKKNKKFINNLNFNNFTAKHQCMTLVNIVWNKVHVSMHDFSKYCLK